MKRICYTVLILVFSVILSSCEGREQTEGNDVFIYYVNLEETGLIQREYTVGGQDVESEVSELLEALKNPPEDIELLAAVPEEVEVLDFSLRNGRLLVNLSTEYNELRMEQKVLLRAAVVQTLVQLDGIDVVGFTAAGEQIRDADGTIIGYQNADDFVQNTGSALHTYQNATLTLYFANETGDRLVSETVDIKYNSNVPMEKLIVEQVIKGPSGRESHPTVNPETKVLSVTIIEDICYVNFNEVFLNHAYDVTPEVAIYSLVNSVIEGTDASQVQISVNGETQVTYMETVDLSQLLTRNDEIIE